MTALPLTCPKARKVLLHKAFRASFTLAAAGYIAARDAAEGGGLALGEGLGAAEAVAEADYLGLALGEDGVHILAQAHAGLAVADALGHVVLLGDDVHERECVAVPVHVDGLRERDVARRLLQRAEIHQYLVLTAAGGVGGEAHALFGAVGVDALDEADGADGDEVVGVVGLSVVLLDYVRDEAEIVLDEHVARLYISREPEVYVFALLLR